MTKLYAKLPPDAELPELLETHGTFAQVAHVLGCSATAVAYRCKKLGLKSPGRRGGRRICSFCQTPSEERPVLRFQLDKYVEGSKTHRTRGAGTLLLCEPCWRAATNAARILPRRPRLRAVA